MKEAGSMRRLTKAILVATLSMVPICPEPAWPDSDEARVRQVILDVADAVMAFPRTKNYESVLRFFAKDYMSIDDSERGSIENLKHTLRELERDSLQETVTITEEISHLEVHVEGTVAWSTYDDVLRITHSSGIVGARALCTAVFRKIERAWLYTHEHCSSYSTEPGTGLQERSKLTKTPLTSAGASGRRVKFGEDKER